ncbi:MAG: hypothetical protein KAW46_04670 [candidate division Zixibacteria bacterium]|nr:hypothetical protein [candidate division Zixibacteria bacterium]
MTNDNPNAPSAAVRQSFVYREIICFPRYAMESVRTAQAKKALSEACVDYRGWPYVFFLPDSRVPPQYADDGIWACTNEPFGVRPMFNYWRFDYQRAVYYSQDMTPESSLKKPALLDPTLQMSLLAESVIAMGRLYDTLEVPLNDALVFCMRISPMNGVRLGSLDEMKFRIYAHEPFSGDTLSVQTSDRLSRFLTQSSDLAADLTVELCDKMGYAGTLGKDFFLKIGNDHLRKGQKTSSL